MSNVEQEVKDIISKKLGIEKSRVVNEAGFDTELGADSLDQVDLLLEFEQHFNITISEDEQTQIKTVGDAVTYVERNIEKSNNN